MAKSLPESPVWEDSIFQLETDTPVLGGADGPDNWQAQQLANRTQYLKQYIEALSSGETPYTNEAAAQQAISAGKISEGAKFSVRSDDTFIWVLEYQNISGTATQTGKTLPSSEFVMLVAKGLNLANADIVKILNRITPLDTLISDKIDLAFTSSAGPVESAMALDKNWGLMLAGLEKPLQDYVIGVIPDSLKNRFPGVLWGVIHLQTRQGLILLMENGDLHIPGVDGPLQDALGLSAATIKMVDGKPALFWHGQRVWNEHYVTSATPVSDSGVLFNYEQSDGSGHSGLMFIPSLREVPVTTAYILIYICLGQSLGAAFDKPGQNIKVWGAEAEFRGRCMSPSGRADGNSAPYSPTDLDRITDNNYNFDRQGHNLPLQNCLMYDMKSAGLDLPSIINAPCNAGGQPLSGISKGTFSYTKSLKYIERSVQFAQGIGKPYQADFILFEHGETDNDNGNCRNPGDYRTLLVPYFTDCFHDFKNILSQQKNPTIVIGQVGSRINTKAGSVDPEGNPTGESEIVQPYSVTATDQLDYVRQHSTDAIMYGSKYVLNHLYNDGSLSHLNQFGKVLQGEYAEQAIFWHIYDPVKKGTWRSNRVKSITVSGNVITYTRHVPYPPLVLDSEFIGDCPGKGHSLELGSATVELVELVGADTVKITLDQAPSQTDHLLIGFTNTTPANNGNIYPVVCIRDSSTKVSRKVMRNGAAFPLYNWAVLERVALDGSFTDTL
ncbi:hypothetical protein [Serratia nevei]|uniref:hypothetical protein n=6 Tax=Serratia TaxID=613 RepID=UPI00313DFAD2